MYMYIGSFFPLIAWRSACIQCIFIGLNIYLFIPFKFLHIFFCLCRINIIYVLNETTRLWEKIGQWLHIWLLSVCRALYGRNLWILVGSSGNLNLLSPTYPFIAKPGRHEKEIRKCSPCWKYVSDFFRFTYSSFIYDTCHVFHCNSFKQ